MAHAIGIFPQLSLVINKCHYRPQKKLWEGNFFTCICQSVHQWGVWCHFLSGPMFLLGRGMVWGYGILYPLVLTSSGGHQSGRNASYWNVFLLSSYFTKHWWQELTSVYLANSEFFKWVTVSNVFKTYNFFTVAQLTMGYTYSVTSPKTHRRIFLIHTVRRFYDFPPSTIQTWISCPEVLLVSTIEFALCFFTAITLRLRWNLVRE